MNIIHNSHNSSLYYRLNAAAAVALDGGEVLLDLDVGQVVIR